MLTNRRKELFENVTSLIGSGLSIRKACAAAGVSRCFYYNIQRIEVQAREHGFIDKRLIKRRMTLESEVLGVVSQVHRPAKSSCRLILAQVKSDALRRAPGGDVPNYARETVRKILKAHGCVWHRNRRCPQWYTKNERIPTISLYEDLSKKLTRKESVRKLAKEATHFIPEPRQLRAEVRNTISRMGREDLWNSVLRHADQISLNGPGTVRNPLFDRMAFMRVHQKRVRWRRPRYVMSRALLVPYIKSRRVHEEDLADWTVNENGKSQRDERGQLNCDYVVGRVESAFVALAGDLDRDRRALSSVSEKFELGLHVRRHNMEKMLFEKLVSDIDREEVIKRYDAHFLKKLNKIVAVELYKLFKEELAQKQSEIGKTLAEEQATATKNASPPLPASVDNFPFGGMKESDFNGWIDWSPRRYVIRNPEAKPQASPETTRVSVRSASMELVIADWERRGLPWKRILALWMKSRQEKARAPAQLPLQPI